MAASRQAKAAFARTEKQVRHRRGLPSTPLHWGSLPKKPLGGSLPGGLRPLAWAHQDPKPSAAAQPLPLLLPALQLPRPSPNLLPILNNARR